MAAVKKPDPMRLLEADVTRQVKDYLSYRGWRPIRNQVVASQNQAGGWIRSGERGMTDWLFIFYLRHRHPGESVTLWLEMKSPGAGLDPAQVKWQREELARGALVLTTDNFEEFEEQYNKLFGWIHGEHGQGRLALEGEMT